MLLFSLFIFLPTSPPASPFLPLLMLLPLPGGTGTAAGLVVAAALVPPCPALFLLLMLLLLLLLSPLLLLLYPGSVRWVCTLGVKGHQWQH